MPDDRRTGLPDVDPLIEVREAAQRALEGTMAVGAAEGVVAGARQAELAAEQRAAYRRLAAARGLLTRARRDGGADRIAAAAARVDAAYAEFDSISDRVIAEMQQLTRARSENLDRIFTGIRESWAAGDAVTDAFARARLAPAARSDTEPGAGPGSEPDASAPDGSAP